MEAESFPGSGSFVKAKSHLHWPEGGEALFRKTDTLQVLTWDLH
jgi:hypothetical protein